jgi:hypothetical protein
MTRSPIPVTLECDGAGRDRLFFAPGLAPTDRHKLPRLPGCDHSVPSQLGARQFEGRRGKLQRFVGARIASEAAGWLDRSTGISRLRPMQTQRGCAQMLLEQFRSSGPPLQFTPILPERSLYESTDRPRQWPFDLDVMEKSSKPAFVIVVHGDQPRPKPHEVTSRTLRDPITSIHQSHPACSSSRRYSAATMRVHAWPKGRHEPRPILLTARCTSHRSRLAFELWKRSF